MNVGISAIKTIACFCIVIMHCGTPCKLLGVSVHVFMFLAMFLCSERLHSVGHAYVIRRLKRIAVLYFSWGFLAMLPFSVFYGKIEMDKFAFQMVLGSPYDPPLYFLTLLMLYTIMAYCVCRFSNRFRTGLSMAFVLCCFFVQYTGLNFSLTELCVKIPPFPRCTIGRFVELLPSAFAGLLLGDSSTRKKIFGGKMILIGLFIVFFSAIWYRVDLIKEVRGYDYQGVGLFGLSVGLSLLFIGVGDLLCGDTRGACMIHGLSRVTVGIYATHVLIANAFTVVLPQFEKGVLFVLTIFVLSLMVSLAMGSCKLTTWLVR